MYTHLSLIGTLTTPSLMPDEIGSQTRESYNGPLAVGEDLMAFEIGAEGVAIYRRGPH